MIRPSRVRVAVWITPKSSRVSGSISRPVAIRAPSRANSSMATNELAKTSIGWSRILLIPSLPPCLFLLPESTLERSRSPTRGAHRRPVAIASSESDDEPRVDDITIRRVARVAELPGPAYPCLELPVDLPREHEVERNEPGPLLLVVRDRVVRIEQQRPAIRQQEG